LVRRDKICKVSLSYIVTLISNGFTYPFVQKHWLRSVDGGENFEIVSEPDSLQFEDPSDAGGTEVSISEMLGEGTRHQFGHRGPEDRSRPFTQEQVQDHVIGDDDVVRRTEIYK